MSCEVVKNRSTVFGAPNYCGVEALKILRLFITVVYPIPCDKVWLSYVVSACAKPGNEEKCKIFGGWVKLTVQFEAVCGPKFMSFRDDIGNSL